jgi:1,2-diacylglycerol 3-alpha-glucosyltransferase
MLSAPKICIVWASFSAYHLARCRALGALAPVTAIEFASFHRAYGWHPDRSAKGFAICSLSDRPYEDESTPRLVHRLWRVLDSVAPSVVFAPGYSDLRALSVALWAKAHGKRCVLMSDSTEKDFARVCAREALKSFLVRHGFDAGFVAGRRAHDYIVKLGLDPLSVFTKRDVVDNQLFKSGVESFRRCGLSEYPDLQQPYFLFVGRLAKEKNLDVLLRAFSEYCHQGGRWNLVVVGGGPERQRLSCYSEQLDCSTRIRWYGFQEGTALLKFYAFASCLVLPSVKEPWGLVVNEAMASSLPVLVSTRCGCVPELVHNGVNGFSFDPTDCDALQFLLSSMQALTRDDLAQFGANSLSIVNEFSLDAWARQAIMCC